MSALAAERIVARLRHRCSQKFAQSAAGCLKVGAVTYLIVKS
ncbi:hypothetical protein [Luteolibacter sp. AS25]